MLIIRLPAGRFELAETWQLPQGVGLQGSSLVEGPTLGALENHILDSAWFASLNQQPSALTADQVERSFAPSEERSASRGVLGGQNHDRPGAICVFRHYPEAPG